MIAETLDRQTKQVFKTLLESIELCPRDDFRLDADSLHESIGRIAMHIGGSIENTFLTDAFRAKWNSPVASQDECVRYIASCRDDLILPFVQKEDLAGPDEQPEYFISKMDRVMKILRHIAHHTGEIVGVLRAKGISGVSFI